MFYDIVEKLPSRVQVSEVVCSRYDHLAAGERPPGWEARKDGIDVVKATAGKVIALLSEGQQSVPAKGWVLMLRGGNPEDGYRWTLYGLAAQP